MTPNPTAEAIEALSKVITELYLLRREHGYINIVTEEIERGREAIETIRACLTAQGGEGGVMAVDLGSNEWHCEAKYETVKCDCGKLHKFIVESKSYPVTATPKQPGWMPIESAPRDGSRFVIAAYRENRNIKGEWFWDVQIAYWCDVERHFETSACNSFDGPQYWKSLPTAPADLTTDGETK